VGAGSGQVAAGPLVLSAGLRARPNRQWDSLRRGASTGPSGGRLGSAGRGRHVEPPMPRGVAPGRLLPFSQPERGGTNRDNDAIDPEGPHREHVAAEVPMGQEQGIANSQPESVWRQNRHCGRLTAVPNTIALPTGSGLVRPQ
jgi:hypothetical protein